MNAPTGQQHVIERGSSRATIVELAAGLRELVIDGIEVVQGYPADAMPPFGDGIVLMPWPNRVEDGRWTLDGQPQQLDLTEVERNNAIHGLLRNAPYRLVRRTAESVELAATVFPQHGYPFHLETTVRYALVAGALEVTHGVRNVGTGRAPVAVGTHPFLKVGDVPVDELTLTIHADTHIAVDARLNPIEEHPVDGTDWDLRAGRRVGDLELDDAWGGVRTVGGASAVLTAPSGAQTRLLQDAAHGYVQAFITRVFPGAGTDGGPGTAIALEPMTAPANAFNSGAGLHWLEPGAAWSVGWGIQYSAGD